MAVTCAGAKCKRVKEATSVLGLTACETWEEAQVRHSRRARACQYLEEQRSMHEFSPTFKSPSLNLGHTHAGQPVSGLLLRQVSVRCRKLARRTFCLCTCQSTKL
jgi:hypothetical protein